jgi:hypothetical protein
MDEYFDVESNTYKTGPPPEHSIEVGSQWVCEQARPAWRLAVIQEVDASRVKVHWPDVPHTEVRGISGFLRWYHPDV